MIKNIKTKETIKDIKTLDKKKMLDSLDKLFEYLNLLDCLIDCIS